jgi:anti-anti-sigma factor
MNDFLPIVAEGIAETSFALSLLRAAQSRLDREGSARMSPPTTIPVSIERVVNVTVARFEEKQIIFDEPALEDLHQRLQALVNNDENRKLILNFELVDAFCSYLLGILFRLHKRLVQDLKGKLVFCGVKKHLREIFEITTLDKLVEIVPDEQAALQRF